MQSISIKSLLPILLFLSSCHKTADKPSGLDKTIVLTATADNLVTDGDFTAWDQGSHHLAYWTTVHTNDGVIRSTDTGVAFAAIAAGSYYIYQRITLEARKFYKASVKATYTLNDYSPAGIYVMDTSMTRVLGKFEKVYNQATGDEWQFLFYSRRPEPVSLVLGFLNGINGAASFSGATVAEYSYEPRIRATAFSNHLQEKLNLSFTSTMFDSSISLIGDYVNNVLLSPIKFYDDTVENTFLDGAIGTEAGYTYFNQYRRLAEQVRDGYCQRSSLSLGEILANEFNIPVRQMHMQFGGIGKHQFQEYWNPFSRRWIIIDPCFNARYKRDGRLLGDEDFTRDEAPRLMVRFGSHYFYDDLTELEAYWQGMDELYVLDYYTLTFPFTNL